MASLLVSATSPVSFSIAKRNVFGAPWRQLNSSIRRSFKQSLLQTHLILQNNFIQNQLKYASSERCVVKSVLGNQVQSEGDIDEVCELVNGAELVLGEQDSFNAYLLKAMKNNNGAAVLLLSDVFGFEDSGTRDFAYRLSCNGYNVLVPDLYRGEPWSKDRPQSEFEEWRRKHLPQRVANDIDISAKWLLDEFSAAGISDKLGIVGFCFGGGRLVETLARDTQSHFGAAVCFYGTRFDPSLASQLKIPVLFIVGENDPLCPVDLLRQMESQIKGSQVCVYAGRGHGFAHHPESVEEDEDAEDAFTKVLVKGEPNISYICSRYYRAPELIFGATEYTTAIDVWSTGCVMAELLLGQPLFPGESGVDQLVEIIKVLGTPTREEIKCMNPNYPEFKFPQIKAHPWQKLFHRRAPAEAIDLLSRILQYSPSLRCTALEACAHPFFDELRDPSTCLPNGRPLPPLFNFKPHELKGATPDLIQKLIPDHARK